jgi:coenzyme F420-reducing hydrogenase beta subunit
MQLQLQKKLQQKNNEVKERKRKIQVGCFVFENLNYVSLVGRLKEEKKIFLFDVDVFWGFCSVRCV